MQCPNPARSPIKIIVDDLSGQKIAGLLTAHISNLRMPTHLPDSVHALDLDALNHQDITFWSAWDGPQLVGCIALKELNACHGEIKSMHTIKHSAPQRHRTPASEPCHGRGQVEILRSLESRNWRKRRLRPGAPPL